MSGSMKARRAWSGPAIFSLGLRPFFLGGALLAAMAIPMWTLGFVLGQRAYGGLDAMAWHIHEMVFGFLSAVIAGFLLTAVPNWTGRLPVTGRPLALLFALWAMGRLAAAGPVPLGVAAAMDVAFPATLLGLLAREVAAGRNWRNLPVVGLVAVFTVGDGLFWAARLGWSAADGWGERLALAATAMLIVLIGGRIVPSFTRNWLAARKETAFPRPFGAVDKVAMMSAGAAWMAWTIAPTSRHAGIALLMAAAAQAVRLSGWRGGATWREPLVAVLHVGYGWLVFAMALMGAAALAPETLPASAALHAFTAGAAPMMILAVMTRASRGHTGRALTADRATTAIYLLVSAGALIRCLGPALVEDWLWTAALGGGIWTAGFALFVIAYGPMLLRPRAAGG